MPLLFVVDGNQHPMLCGTHPGDVEQDLGRRWNKGVKMAGARGSRLEDGEKICWCVCAWKAKLVRG